MSNVNHEIRKSEDQTGILFEFFIHKMKKMIHREFLPFTREEIMEIYENLLLFFNNVDSPQSTLKEGIKKRFRYLVPISQILSNQELNHMNLEPFKSKNVKRGAYGIVSMNKTKPNQVEKIRQLRVKNEVSSNENIQKSMNISHLFMGDIIPLDSSHPGYKKIYERFHYDRNNNYNPAQILISTIIQEYCHRYTPSFVPRINQIVFYRKLAKINMERIKGYELFDVTNSIPSTSVIDVKFIDFKRIVLHNFSKVLWGIFTNFSSLYDQIGFVHLDMHYHNIFIQNDIVNALSENKNNFYNAGLLLSCAKIIDFDFSFIVCSLVDEKLNKGFTKKIIRNFITSSIHQELLYLKGRLDREKLEELINIYIIYYYIHPTFNPILTSLYTQLKLLFTILFGETDDIYQVEPVVENLIVSKLNIIEGYHERMDYIIGLYTSTRRKPLNSKELFHFKIRMVSSIYRLRNYVLFNVPLPRNKRNIFLYNDENLIERDYDEFSSRFRYENLIHVFST